MPVHQMRRAAANPVFIRRLLESTNHRRMIRQAQIIIAAKGEHGFAIDNHVRLLRRIGKAWATVQVLNLTFVQHLLQAL